MARAALDWSQRELAKAAGVSARTVIRYEAGEAVHDARVQKLATAFKDAGVLFLADGKFAGAVVPPPERA